MTRFLSLTLLLCATAASHGQFVIRMRPPSPVTRPAGVIPPPAVPIPGQPIGRTVQPLGAAPYLSFNPWGLYSGYLPFYPSWDEPENPRQVINNYYTLPAPQPVAPNNVPTPAPLPVETKARLVLNVPRGAEVIVSGKKLDTAVRPLVVLSPDLKPGEVYLFDVQVKWREDDRTEERTRQLRLEAGDVKSLSYFAVK